MTAIIFALIAAVGWGTADIFGGLVAKKIGGYSSAVVSYILSLLIASLYIPFALNDLTNISQSSVIWLLILTPIGVIPLIALYEGIKVGNASLVGTIGGANGALVVVLSLIFLGERINFLQGVFILVIMLGILFSSLDFKSFKTKYLLSDKGIPYALLAMITWAIWYTFVKLIIDNIGWFWPAYFSWLGFPLVLLYMKAKSIKFIIPKDLKNITFSLVNALLLTIALFAYNYAVVNGQNAIVSPVSSTYPALFAIIAYFAFKDRLSKQQIFGIIITLAGVISLSLVS